MKTLLMPPSTDVVIGENLLTSDQLKAFCTPFQGKRVVIADHSIQALYGVPLAAHLSAEFLTIPSGEQTKSQAMATDLMDRLFKLGAGRDTLLIALGGGVTTDLVAFVASIYMRGLPLLLIPTTLLAMVDAAIGGKTGIDTPYGKNLIGTFYHPKGIFADLKTLDTLPEKEQFNGLAEILKLALIHDRSIWEEPLNPTLIAKAVEGKIAIVSQDPTEQSIRRILNFGHTIAHPLETLSRYTLSHGEAVALGCLVESYLSLSLGYLEKKEFDTIEARYRSFPLQLPKNYLRENLLKAMGHDKKKERGQIRFVLIDRIGHALPFEGAYCRAVTLAELEPTLDWMERTCV